MPGTHSTGQLLLWLVYRRGLCLLHSLTHFFTDGVAILFCRLILVTTGSFFLFFDTRYSRVVLVSLDPRYSRIGLLLCLATRIDPIDTDCFVNSIGLLR